MPESFLAAAGEEKSSLLLTLSMLALAVWMSRAELHCREPSPCSGVTRPEERRDKIEDREFVLLGGSFLSKNRKLGSELSIVI